MQIADAQLGLVLRKSHEGQINPRFRLRLHCAMSKTTLKMVYVRRVLANSRHYDGNAREKPMLLNTTIGGSSADSFIAIDEADTFLSGGPYNTDGWAELSDDQKVLRLVLAAKLMGCMTWAKFPVYDRQALCFPRRGPKCGKVR